MFFIYNKKVSGIFTIKIKKNARNIFLLIIKTVSGIFIIKYFKKMLNCFFYIEKQVQHFFSVNRLVFSNYILVIVMKFTETKKFSNYRYCYRLV